MLIYHFVGFCRLDPKLTTTGFSLTQKKMGWVMNEVLRLYATAPNAQRQAREDIRVGEFVIPNGTNMWVDIVGMHHDRALWGEDVNRFRPERFRDDQMHGGCKHKMGFFAFRVWRENVCG